MTFELWRKKLFLDVANLGFRQTGLKYGVSISSIQNIIKKTQAGEPFAGHKTYENYLKKASK